jgi:hypothetical protein
VAESSAPVQVKAWKCLKAWPWSGIGHEARSALISDRRPRGPVGLDQRSSAWAHRAVHPWRGLAVHRGRERPVGGAAAAVGGRVGEAVAGGPDGHGQLYAVARPLCAGVDRVLIGGGPFWVPRQWLVVKEGRPLVQVVERENDGYFVLFINRPGAPTDPALLKAVQ